MPDEDDEAALTHRQILANAARGTVQFTIGMLVVIVVAVVLGVTHTVSPLLASVIAAGGTLVWALVCIVTSPNVKNLQRSRRGL
jgi:hypothetical protein